MVHPILSYMLNSCRLRIHKIWKYSVRSIWSGHFDEICLTIDSTSNVIPSPARMILSIYRKLKYCIADVHMYKHIFLKRKYIHVYIYIYETQTWCLSILNHDVSKFMGFWLPSRCLQASCSAYPKCVSLGLTSGTCCPSPGAWDAA